MMIKNFFYCITCVILSVLCSCGHDDVEFKEMSGGQYETVVSGVSIKVSPISLKVGEEMTVEASCENGTEIPIVVILESLGIKETLTTPFVWKKTLNIEGRHELEFFMGNKTISILTSTTINVRK